VKSLSIKIPSGTARVGTTGKTFVKLVCGCWFLRGPAPGKPPRTIILTWESCGAAAHTRDLRARARRES
jgi:hypothetical protein